MKISTVQQMRGMDQKAVHQYSIPELLLMENAGLSAVNYLKNKLSLPGLKVLVICGPGNNGGDGFAISRILLSEKSQVTTLILSDPEKYQGSAKTNYQILQHIENQCCAIDEDTFDAGLIHNTDLIIDAIFGTGLTRPPEGIYAQVISEINASNKPVLSIDIPSGINGDTGQVMGIAIKANWTITFGLPKTGNLLYPGYEYEGELSVSHISFPPELYEDPSIQCEINNPPDLPPRKPDGHKGTFGQALFISGASNYYGAPFFSAYSFMKAGGGYSRLACPRSIAPYIASKGSEIVFIPQEETSEGSLAQQNLAHLLELSTQSDMVVVGPGISLQEETQALTRDLIKKIDKPLLIDGDGLTSLSSNLDLLTLRKNSTILTPHPGEMARLSGEKLENIKNHPIEIVREFCQHWKVILILKGAHTLIGSPDGKVYINMTGNSGMGTAGSGDVLTGTIAAMYCLGLDVTEAAKKGVLMHGLAGDIAANKIGLDGMTATSILDHLPEALSFERDGRIKSFYEHYQNDLSRFL